MKVNRPFMLGILSLATSLSAVSSALAANPYPSAYDATYTIVDNKGTSTSHKLSDGMGHTRTDTTMGIGKTKVATAAKQELCSPTWGQKQSMAALAPANWSQLKGAQKRPDRTKQSLSRCS